MEGLGINLNSYKGLQFFTAASPQELHAQLMQITFPYHIIAIYAVGGAHVAWIDCSRKINKIEKTKKVKEK